MVQAMHETLLFKDHTSDLASFRLMTTNHEYFTSLPIILQATLADGNVSLSVDHLWSRLNNYEMVSHEIVYRHSWFQNDES